MNRQLYSHANKIFHRAKCLVNLLFLLNLCWKQWEKHKSCKLWTAEFNPAPIQSCLWWCSWKYYYRCWKSPLVYLHYFKLTDLSGYYHLVYWFSWSIWWHEVISNTDADTTWVIQPFRQEKWLLWPTQEECMENIRLVCRVPPWLKLNLSCKNKWLTAGIFIFLIQREWEIKYSAI